jgi:hypothetical protein
MIEHRDGVLPIACLRLLGCQTQGDTVEEASANLSEAAGLCLETLDGPRRFFGGINLIGSSKLTI